MAVFSIFFFKQNKKKEEEEDEEEGGCYSGNNDEMPRQFLAFAILVPKYISVISSYTVRTESTRISNSHIYDLHPASLCTLADVGGFGPCAFFFSGERSERMHLSYYTYSFPTTVGVS